MTYNSCKSTEEIVLNHVKLQERIHVLDDKALLMIMMMLHVNELMN